MSPRRRRPSLRTRLGLVLTAVLLLSAAVWTGTSGRGSPGPLLSIGVVVALVAWGAHRRR